MWLPRHAMPRDGFPEIRKHIGSRTLESPYLKIVDDGASRPAAPRRGAFGNVIIPARCHNNNNNALIKLADLCAFHIVIAHRTRVETRKASAQLRSRAISRSESWDNANELMSQGAINIDHSRSPRRLSGETSTLSLPSRREERKDAGKRKDECRFS